LTRPGLFLLSLQKPLHAEQLKRAAKSVKR
jgi:hypothetical protein